MRTFHLHISGRVQGVGFRPYMYKFAKEKKLNGLVRNDTDGVHVLFNCDSSGIAQSLSQSIVDEAPDISIIQDFHYSEISNIAFDDFSIAQSKVNSTVKLLITPDLGICKSCSEELVDFKNRRYKYPFITCTKCGPRYSIMRDLPYDRPNTSMEPFQMCSVCQDEYDNISDIRHYSQTNSCPTCPVSLSLYGKNSELLSHNASDIIFGVRNHLEGGKIIAVKGIGGYMLMCDATKVETIKTLRRLKHRPTKPFAVMYPSLQMLSGDVHLNSTSTEVLNSPASPIVILPIQKTRKSNIAHQIVAPNLDSLGVMLPYTGLYKLLTKDYPNPLIATSGNVSNSPIVFNDIKALEELTTIADYIVTNDREIVVPQDDSVLRYNKAKNEHIIIRRSRGLAPAIHHNPIKGWKSSVLATGADLKSAFGLSFNGEVYLSQYLGNLQFRGTQDSYRHTLSHFNELLDFNPEVIIADCHPGYYSSQLATEIADRKGIRIEKVQHHLAHFAANLGENNLIQSKEPVLGVVFDGTGYGTNNHIWGGEFFKYQHHTFERMGHLRNFDHKCGDKMSREPRISALSLFGSIPDAMPHIKSKFTKVEWDVYASMLNSQLKTSSIGRLFDAVASILGLCDVMSYEGEAAIYLEQEAQRFYNINPGFERSFQFSIDKGGILNIDECLNEICHDFSNEVSIGEIACRFHNTIAYIIEAYAELSNVSQISLSGGVFQNVFLIDACERLIDTNFKLHLHKEMSPNDENIAYGQLIYQYIKESNNNK